MRRLSSFGAVALLATILSGCVYNDYGCFAEATPEVSSDVPTSANAYLVSLADDDEGREREYTRESSRRNNRRHDGYGRRRDPYYGGYGDRRRPYGC